MDTSEDELVAFFERHAATLRSLHLDTLGVMIGDWTSALCRIRSCLNHPEMLLLEGYLTSENPRRSYDFGLAELGDPEDEVDRPLIARRKALETWFKSGGDCPLVKEWSNF